MDYVNHFKTWDINRKNILNIVVYKHFGYVKMFKFYSFKF